MRLTPAIAALVLSAAALSACSTEEEMKAIDPAGESAGEAAADEAPAEEDTGAPSPVSDGTVRTTDLVTVIDDGAGPQMCLGAVAKSLPPQCSGIPVEGFEFGDTGVEEAAGVRWGLYSVTGTFDGETFSATEAVPAALYDPGPTEDLGDAETPGPACESPETTDPALASQEALDATLAAASALPGYATSWISGDTFNVAVTEDADGAETKLRETWGGQLCVTEAEHTEAELNTISQELQAELPTLLTSGSSAVDSIDAWIVFDDGSIQEWADETYGDGLVTITSALEPAE